MKRNLLSALALFVVAFAVGFTLLPNGIETANACNPPSVGCGGQVFCIEEDCVLHHSSCPECPGSGPCDRTYFGHCQGTFCCCGSQIGLQCL